MIRVHTPTLAVADVPLPLFLDGLDESSLVSLLWTDPALGVRDYGWWPLDVAAATAYDPVTQGVSGYTYKADNIRKRVTAIPVIGALPASEVAANQAAARDQAKAARDKAVEAIKVTTSAGHCFDGDEVSQGRMARAILALESKGQTSTPWVLSDNTSIEATPAELREALVLAGQAQTDLWILA
jgi:hypothetical protein